MKTKLKLGTRKSLLAWAQSSWVAREVERLNPGVQVELCGIETRGDVILDISLRKVEGKEFFVAEIDQALRAGNVDLTVHSMKDLSLERPNDLICGAIPRRENPRDIILFGPNTLNRLKNGMPLRIGTSSPRRIENIPDFLSKALPKVVEGKKVQPQMEFIEIRGNVNTRLSRLHEDLNSEKYLDGVVLALAGLIRLWADPRGQEELIRLFHGLRWMILPVKECPAAPAQGALSVECRADDSEVKTILEKLHHPDTATRVSIERQLLSDWGGGCHQRFGATAIQSEELGNLLYIRGAKSTGEFIEDLRWKVPSPLPYSSEKPLKAWDGSQWKPAFNPLPAENFDFKNKPLFVANSRAVKGMDSSQLKEARVWTSGTASWFKLADCGVWVEGCAEGLGFEFVLPLLNEKVLSLPAIREWVVLTHRGAEKEWIEMGMRVVSTYEINFNYLEEAKSELQAATHVFWSSGSQYDELKECVAQNTVHSCGPGKTAAYLRKKGVAPVTFPSAEEWRKWIRINQN